jgi:hypothetical protein
MRASASRAHGLGCWSQGDTEADALANIRDAIREYLLVREGLVRDGDVREAEVGIEVSRSWRQPPRRRACAAEPPRSRCMSARIDRLGQHEIRTINAEPAKPAEVFPVVSGFSWTISVNHVRRYHRATSEARAHPRDAA